MAETMDLKSINKWWKKGIEKEKRRLTNAPTPHKGDRFSVPVDFSNFAPRIPNARRRRSS